MDLNEIKNEMNGKSKEEVLNIAKEADIQKLGLMIVAAQDDLTKELNEFLSGKKIAGSRSRKASLKLQGLFGLWRKNSVVAEKDMGKKKAE